MTKGAAQRSIRTFYETITIAGHLGDDLAIGTLNSILKQAKLKEGK
jgi:predicted RNA binding protein YcfA (HicA-like mRNA interferase family)